MHPEKYLQNIVHSDHITQCPVVYLQRLGYGAFARHLSPDNENMAKTDSSALAPFSRLSADIAVASESFCWPPETVYAAIVLALGVCAYVVAIGKNAVATSAEALRRLL